MKQDTLGTRVVSVHHDTCNTGGKRWTGFLLPWVAVLTLILMAAGCSKTKTVSETIFTGGGIKIRLLEKVEKEGGEPVPRGLDHPWDVQLEELDHLLGAILYQQTVMFFHGKKRRAFPGEKRLLMLKPIQEAFAKATPNQVVDFSFTHRWKWTIISRDTLTDGVLFRKDGKLNCAFRNLAFEDLADPEGSGEPFRGDPTQEPVRTSWVLSVGPGQELVKKESSGVFGGKKFPNWIRLDLSREWSKPVDEETAAEIEEALAEPISEDATPSRAEIEKRMNFLEELHEEGAIPKDSYEKKKKELQDLLEKVEPPPTPKE
jgi:hypothetical protein